MFAFTGITGRLNGAGAEFWGQGGPHAGAHNMHHQNKMPVGPGNGNTGWEEPSPPAARRNTIVPNYDDGTSLWGTPSQPQRMGGNATTVPLSTLVHYVKGSLFSLFVACIYIRFCDTYPTL